MTEHRAPNRPQKIPTPQEMADMIILNFNGGSQWPLSTMLSVWKYQIQRETLDQLDKPLFPGLEP